MLNRVAIRRTLGEIIVRSIFNNLVVVGIAQRNAPPFVVATIIAPNHAGIGSIQTNAILLSVHRIVDDGGTRHIVEHDLVV